MTPNDPDTALTIACALGSPEHAGDDLERLPARRGVVVFEDHQGRTSLLATTANIRELARRRLDPGAENPRAANLRSITSVVRAAPTGSSFESDLLYLELARARLPHTYGAVTDRWQGWFVEVEPQAEFPRFAKTPTSAMAAHAGRRFIGPIADKHAAARFVELLEDLFDLCRYHHILVQAPHATACVYKEMGKCPAPCDGSESMDTYRARLGAAMRFACDPAGAIRAAEAEMGQAAAALEFERAEALRRWIERAGEATKRKFLTAGDLEAMRLICVAPAGTPGWARLIAARAGRWSILMDVRRDGSLEGIDEACARGLDGLGACAFSQPERDRLGLLCTWLGRSEKMRRGVRFVRQDDRFGAALADAIRRDTTGADTEPDTDDGPSQEIEATTPEETSEP